MTLSRIHRGWAILAITVLNTFACLGLARFSLGVILPFMREGLALTYTEAGVVASAVFLGYLASAVFVGSFINRFKEKKVIIASLVLITVGMIISVFSSHFWLAYFTCLIIGVGSGAGNVASLGLVSKWFSFRYRGMALGITNSGSGLGMVFSGFIVPMLMLINNEGWRISWGILAFCVFVIIAINVLFLVDDPMKLNLQPIGVDLKANNGNEREGTKLLITNVYRNKHILFIGAIYFTWGFSYLIFSTFFVDFLIIDVQIDMNSAGRFYAIAGITSIISGFVWGSLSDRIGRMLTLFIVFFIQTILLFAFSITLQPYLIMMETILYAATLWAVPTIMVAAVSEITTAKMTPSAIGLITLFFGIGQWISPIITGSIVEHYSYTIAYYLSAVICFVGSIGCIYLHFALRKSKNRIGELPMSNEYI
jgi:MFS family permease